MYSSTGTMWLAPAVPTRQAAFMPMAFDVIEPVCLLASSTQFLPFVSPKGFIFSLNFSR